MADQLLPLKNQRLQTAGLLPREKDQFRLTANRLPRQKDRLHQTANQHRKDRLPAAILLLETASKNTAIFRRKR